MYADVMAELDQGPGIKELEEAVAKARDAYYNRQPIISDEDFDALVDRIRDLKAGSPAVTAVGAAAPEDSSWAKMAHRIPMGSLDKVKTIEEMTKWIREHSRNLSDQPIPHEELLISDKLDGISIDLVYDEGRLIHAITRGDGETGEDIVANVAKMRGVPTKLSGDFTGQVRGEVVLHKDLLARHFPEQVSTRSTANGTSKRIDGVGCQHLDVYCYKVHGPDFVKASDQMGWLENHGFQTPRWYVTVMAPGAKTPQDIWVEYQQKTRDELEYDIDGLVVEMNDLAYALSLGETGGNPNAAVAWKFPPVTRDTVAEGIEFQVGSTGRITPIAVVRPVRLLGAEVRRASLYNWKYIREIGYHVGARVVITRANDVIPRVVAVTTKAMEPVPPVETCPECGTSTEWDGEYLICPNTATCPAQLEGRIKLWVQKLNILEWGDTLIEKVVAEGLVKGVPDLYRLSVAQLAQLDRMGQTSAKKARDQLWGVIPVSLEDLVGSLGIPLCGRGTVTDIVNAGFDSVDKLRAATLTQLQDIPGVGPRRAKSFRRWVEQSGGLLDELQEVGVKIKERATGSLAGKSFCFTGKMKQKRPVLEKMARDAGGQVKASVGKGLTFLVIADPNSGSTKAKAARMNGTRCISEEEFLGMVGG